MTRIDKEQYEALTRLTRLAQREPEAETWLAALLLDAPPATIRQALDVAAETGPPISTLLSNVLAQHGSAELAELIASQVGFEQTINNLAIESLRLLLADSTWPADPNLDVALRRRHAVKVGLAYRLARDERYAEAAPIADAAIRLGEMLDDPNGSVRARLIDAHDIVGIAHFRQGNVAGAVRSLRASLNLRCEAPTSDVLRLPVYGAVRLGLVLLEGDSAAKAESLGLLIEAANDLCQLLVLHRDPLLRLEDARARDATHRLQLNAEPSWQHTGFDQLVTSSPSGYLLKQLHRCVSGLVSHLEWLEDRNPRLVPLLELGLRSCDVLRRGGPVPEEVAFLARAATVPGILLIDSHALLEKLARAAEEALESGHADLAIHARMTEVAYLRDCVPEQPLALAGALEASGRLMLTLGNPADALRLQQEAVDVLSRSGASPMRLASAWHHLSRRLSAAGYTQEALEVSRAAIEAYSTEFVTTETDPSEFVRLTYSFGQRALEAKVDLPLTDTIAAGFLSMLDRLRDSSDDEIGYATQATSALFDAARRQGRLEIAHQVFERVVRLAEHRPDAINAQWMRGAMGSILVRLAVDDGRVQDACDIFEHVASAARLALGVDALTVEHGKSAADLIAALGAAGRVEAAAVVAESSLGTLLSSVYLGARRREVGDDQERFVGIIRGLAATAPRSNSSQRAPAPSPED